MTEKTTGFYAFFVFKPDHEQRHYMTQLIVTSYEQGISRDKSQAHIFESADDALAAIVRMLKTTGTGGPNYSYTPGVENVANGKCEIHLSF